MAGLGVLFVDDNWLFLRREERPEIIPNGLQREAGVWRYPRLRFHVRSL
jgi:hypothetical protein